MRTVNKHHGEFRAAMEVGPWIAWLDVYGLGSDGVDHVAGVNWSSNMGRAGAGRSDMLHVRSY